MLVRIFFLLAAIGMFAGSWGCYVENKAFRLYGQKAQLTPVDKYIETTTTYKPKRESPFFDNTPHVYKEKGVSTYFLTANNERIEVSAGIPPFIVEKMLAGEDVVITYVSNNPKLVRYDEHTASTIGAAITGIFFLLTSLFFWRRK